MDKKPWYQQKTFWAGAGIIVTGLVKIFSDVLTPEQAAAIVTIFVGLGAIFMRQSVENSKPTIPPVTIDSPETSTPPLEGK